MVQFSGQHTASSPSPSHPCWAWGAKRFWKPFPCIASKMGFDANHFKNCPTCFSYHWRGHSHILKKSTKSLSQFFLRESFAYQFSYARLCFGRQQPAIDAALHRIEQFQPIFQWRVRDRLPLGIAPFASEEPPIAAHALDIDLDPDSVFGDPLPAYLRLGHLQALNRSKADSVAHTQRKASPASRPANSFPRTPAGLKRGKQCERSGRLSACDARIICR